jgi:uncharacterized protein (TIGR03086 family)
MTTAADIRALDRRAVLAGVAVASLATAGDLGRPTPCAGWTLGDLLAHMTAQHLGFAAAARGEGGTADVWEPRPLGDRAVTAYAEAAEQVLAAFAEPGVLERRFLLPEIHPVFAFPAAQAIGFHFVDYVVHGWDVASALGVRYDLDPDLSAAALPIARTVPNGPERLAPGAAFRPGLDAPGDGAGSLEQVLALLGRPPYRPDVAAQAPAAARG